ncbi:MULTISPECIES: hypothetical protein [unclassified Burkholderia]|uniref:hypothetical protein n=1 Tax=unclassified Burkholderia TaxID=2613784 RepID=UPI000F602504|nr:MULTISPECIES: hypothetical protein [unclassified Burkholderia]
MKKLIPRPQPAPLSYGASFVDAVRETPRMYFSPAMRIWRAMKNFLTFSERGNVNPTSTKEAPRTAVTTHRRISDRQVEIMTAAICEVICGAGHVTAENAADAAPALIKAIVVQVSRLNEAIADANSAATARASSKSRGCRCQHSDLREDPSQA